MLYLGSFEMEYVKVIVTFEISNLEFVKLREKRKNPKFGTKNALFHFFFNWLKKLDIFAMSNLELINIQSFMQKEKSRNLELKISYFFTFGMVFENTIFIFLNRHPQICHSLKLQVKICKKKNKFQFETKDALFSYY